MRSVIVLLGILIVVSASSQTVNACSCAGGGSPCDSFGSAAAVFVGTAVAKRENERPKQTDPRDVDWVPMAIKFSVEQSYLGVSSTEVEVSTGRGGGDCGYDFKIGQRYLVYAYRYNDKLSTRSGSGRARQIQGHWIHRSEIGYRSTKQSSLCPNY